MDIAEAVTTDYLEFDPSTRVSKLMGAFKEQGAEGMLINDDVDVAGVVTRKQLLRSRRDPDETAKNLMRNDIPRIDRRDDVREVARLMVESDLNLLPVYDGERFEGVVTAESLAKAVRPNLDALDVSDVYSRDLISVGPDATLGEVINTLRTHGISRVPVIDDETEPDEQPPGDTTTGESASPRDPSDASAGSTAREAEAMADTEARSPVREAVGIASYFDLLEFIVRETDQQEGGNVGGFDGHGGEGSQANYRSHGGHGERAGVESRLLDLPVRDVMSSPVRTTGPTTPLGEATEEMLENGFSSLVVDVPTQGPDGVVTLTDVLRSLTWEPDEEETRLQIFGMNLLTDLSREDVAGMIEEVDGKYEEMDVIEAYVVLQNHRERQRGMPLIRATIRLFTNKGRFAGTGEEYGAAPAIRAARDRLERTVLDDKSHTIEERRSPGEREEAEHLVSWWLES
ncbi:CBS domain-containing protein [Halomicrobium zhouii]|uniref:CBS domain-containing protein n=1 Tax=Halomicrobium zhouii TaxID=767519 RepID=A0A1I6M244_9EURY|nr:CBS domain-containing protein [Halomicrobium zhouii]SFS09698.1 CBS domain-containing protein [Halomicrobium zhouii]